MKSYSMTTIFCKLPVLTGFSKYKITRRELNKPHSITGACKHSAFEGSFIKQEKTIDSFATVQRDILEEAYECGTMYITAENDT